jgi:hypothetical protein
VQSPIGDGARVRAFPAASLDAWCGKQRSSGFVGEPPDASALLLEDPSSSEDTGRIAGRLRRPRRHLHRRCSRPVPCPVTKI